MEIPQPLDPGKLTMQQVAASLRSAHNPDSTDSVLPEETGNELCPFCANLPINASYSDDYVMCNTKGCPISGIAILSERWNYHNNAEFGERCWQACCLDIKPEPFETYPFAIWTRCELLTRGDNSPQEIYKELIAVLDLEIETHKTDLSGHSLMGKDWEKGFCAGLKHSKIVVKKIRSIKDTKFSGPSVPGSGVSGSQAPVLPAVPDNYEREMKGEGAGGSSCAFGREPTVEEDAEFKKKAVEPIDDY